MLRTCAFGGVARQFALVQLRLSCPGPDPQVVVPFVGAGGLIDQRLVDPPIVIKNTRSSLSGNTGQFT